MQEGQWGSGWARHAWNSVEPLALPWMCRDRQGLGGSHALALPCSTPLQGRLVINPASAHRCRRRGPARRPPAASGHQATAPRSTPAGTPLGLRRRQGSRKGEGVRPGRAQRPSGPAGQMAQQERCLEVCSRELHHTRPPAPCPALPCPAPAPALTSHHGPPQLPLQHQ